ncbi:ankyrin repeat domain-containing protein [Flavobacterium tibetense]|uniref:Ankyrin repeat domain-containing protein n=1 Tax=Flavobacterium tibetense TaxID=2233533 RepID=A0A365P432_9FLAO|nr:ankyrin repeat domain-containing protein [Flavobacterium tibetense]RBA29295.1 ankyrin repeat domain-containing protein [Flavobacterium tibetense]
MKNSVLLILYFFCMQGFSQTDIFQIAKNGTVDELKVLLEENPSAINSVDKRGSTPLILASYYNNQAVAFELIDKGAKIDTAIEMGTALMAAVVKGNYEITKILLENGANPNLKDANQSTALVYATLFKNKEIMLLLVKHNADATIKDARNFSALDYAKQFNDNELIQILK